MRSYQPLREELRRAIAELRGDDLSPARGAAAVALGLFIGTLPVFGLHLALVLALCLWLRLDALVAYLAANISNPLVAPALIATEISIGSRIRTGSPPSPEALRHVAGLVGAIGDLALGAPILAVALGALGYAATYLVLAVRFWIRPTAGRRLPYALPVGAPPWVVAVEKAATRYAHGTSASLGDRSRFHYVRTKLLGDPVAQMIAGIEGDAPAGLGDVFDVGTGRGQLPVLLLELGRATRADGVDWDRAKIESATWAAGGFGVLPTLAASFRVADVREVEIPMSDTVAIVDVLHYLNREEQDRLLRRAAAAVKGGGRIVVREADTERGLRSTLTRLEEAIFTGIGVNRGARVLFRPLRELRGILETMGFVCEVRPAWGRTPFSNMLLIGRKPQEREAGC